MYLLLRKSCSLYQDFAIYCTARNIKIKANETPTIPVKKLVSPKLQPETKLSPLAPYQRLTPTIKPKSKPSVLATLSKFRHKEEEKKNIETPPEKADPIIIDVKGDVLIVTPEEDKIAGKQTFTDYTRKLWIDPSGISKMCLSPLMNTEGIRHTPAETSSPGIAGLPEEGKTPPVNLAKEIVLCGCGQPCNIKEETQCSDCLAKLKPGTQFDYLYEKRDDQNLWRYFYKILGTQLYRITRTKQKIGYSRNNDEAPNAIYSLAGCYLREELEEMMENKKNLYPFIIYFGASNLRLYAIKKEERSKWMQVLKEASGYINMKDFYDLKVDIKLSVNRNR
jgi:hypothetical protein